MREKLSTNFDHRLTDDKSVPNLLATLALCPSLRFGDCPSILRNFTLTLEKSTKGGFAVVILKVAFLAPD